MLENDEPRKTSPNKTGEAGRDRINEVLVSSAERGYVPAAFFLHFDPECRRGQAAVDKHIEFFRYTEMDFVKIQYENKFPAQDNIKKPADWGKVVLPDKEFFAEPLAIVKGLVREMKKEAYIVQTLYSPFMCARHVGGEEAIATHMREDPEKVKRGLEIATEGLLVFIKECKKLGLDGFYASSQGGERERFEDPTIFKNYIKPYDMVIWDELRTFEFNILHICDYQYRYDSLDAFLDYPGDVVNCSLELLGSRLTASEVQEKFNRPFMGGLDRLGVLYKGSEEEVRQEALRALGEKSSRFILGADCTVPGDTDWGKLRTAVRTAHGLL